MSGWDQYVQQIASMGGVEKVAIVGEYHDASTNAVQKSVWAKNSGFKDDAASTKCLLDLLDFQNNIPTFQASGIYPEPNVKFMFVRPDENYIVGKKNQDTLYVVSFKQGVFVVIHNSEGVAGNILNTVNKLADHIRTSYGA
ncbi:hypothetical protein IWW36_003172 [Coemansia brasiliensis]|uniref:Profilin n=1 Tax=Coemansia brasiliensis TaxID=2650707 RepID=A0A9W8IC50_9FUNG|nr:hypothetical protein IWW36_003172 [Coemansia brasiliensis]